MDNKKVCSGNKDSEGEYIKPSSCPSLYALEKLFNTSIEFFGYQHFKFNVKHLINNIATQSSKQPIAVLIQTDYQQNTIRKAALFLYTSLQFRYLKFRVEKLPSISIKTYGIYPNIEQPFAIYQLNTTAENYTNANILPAEKNSLKGKLAKILSSIAQYHASTAGIVILIEKKS